LQDAVTESTDSIWPELVRQISAHLDEIAAEMVKEIQARLPEYARPLDPTYARTVRVAVDNALHHFLDVLARRDGGQEHEEDWREMFRAIGAGEMREGRSLDTLQAALRLCARVGWRWLVDFAQAEGASVQTVGILAEGIFTYLDQIADASAAGYAQAQAAAAGELARRRRRLLELVLTDPPVSPDTIAAAAHAARWRVPRSLAAVALDARAALATPPVLAPEILAGLDRPEPCLLVPDPELPAQAQAVTAAVHRFRSAIDTGFLAAVGPAVPVSGALRSLRWARHALALSRRGMLTGEPPVWCRDHLATLAVFQDEELLAALVTRRLAPLSEVRDGQRQPLVDTLLAWLQLDRNVADVAARLHVHPQTVRYRLRQLDRLFGPDLRDPGLRFELEVALRALSGGYN
jgi:hypothetical protein